MNTKRLAIILAVGLLGLAVALLWLPILSEAEGLTGQAKVAGAAELTVCPAGPPDCQYDSVQEAVDAASDGALIKVATGKYTDVHGRPVPPGYQDPPASGIISQVVYISKTVAIRGGYVAPDFVEPPDPVAHPTTLDAERQGRVLVVAGEISPTIDGLRLTGGDASGLGGGYGTTRDTGGGVHVSSGRDGPECYFSGGVYICPVTVAISNCVIYNNRASTTRIACGGGLYLLHSYTTLSGNTVMKNTASTGGSGFGGGLCTYDDVARFSDNKIISNTASTDAYGQGGGLYLGHSEGATLSGNTVQGNIASTAYSSYSPYFGEGGGLYLHDCGEPGAGTVTLSGNTVQGNTASTAHTGRGGGLYVEYGAATLNGNTVQGNIASTVFWGGGGGLHLRESDAMLSGNMIISNTATLSPTAWGYGGGLAATMGSSSTLTNNLVADNQANSGGSGLYVDTSSARLLHTTIADNHGSGRGVDVVWHSTLACTNTILAGHANVGITVTAGSTATLEATLWYDNGADTGGEGTLVTGTVNIWDDPAFVDPASWDYHIGPESAARDAGVDAGIMEDIDGDPRPSDAGFDIGADEFYVPAVYLPLVLRAFP